MEIMQVTNPQTGRAVRVGGRVWRSLVESGDVSAAHTTPNEIAYGRPGGWFVYGPKLGGWPTQRAASGSGDVSAAHAAPNEVVYGRAGGWFDYGPKLSMSPRWGGGLDGDLGQLEHEARSAAAGRPVKPKAVGRAARQTAKKRRSVTRKLARPVKPKAVGRAARKTAKKRMSVTQKLASAWELKHARKTGMLATVHHPIVRKQRQGTAPFESATMYHIGTRKIGNDNQTMHKVIPVHLKTGKTTHRWAPA
jgi:hypothetical protein